MNCLFVCSSCSIPFEQDVEHGNTTHLGDCEGEFSQSNVNLIIPNDSMIRSWTVKCNLPTWAGGVASKPDITSNSRTRPCSLGSDEEMPIIVPTTSLTRGRFHDLTLHWRSRDPWSRTGNNIDRIVTWPNSVHYSLTMGKWVDNENALWFIHRPRNGLIQLGWVLHAGDSHIP